MAERDPRRLAFDVLVEVERRRAYSGAALGRALTASALAADDRRLAAQLVYGVLSRRGTLDFTITAYARRSKIDPRVEIALRLGLYQIAFLDRVPAYAAADTTVSIVRGFAPHATGFVNALLRRAAREGLSPAPAGEPERTAVLLSHPAWLVEMWRAELGDAEALALMAANNEPMPTVLRALIDRDDAMEELRLRGFSAAPARHAPDAIRCALPYPAPGVALPQGEASQLVVLLVGAQCGERVLDACAAPGGKTAYLAALVGDTGRVIAADAAADAEARVEATCATAGVRNVDVVAAAVEHAGDLGTFDAALVDAPCSGLGTLREHPEIRWRRSRADLADLAGRQTAILDAAAARVRPGGRLVYSTCTISRTENDDVVARFLASHPEFREAGADDAHPALQPLLDAGGRLRTFPHRHDMAGFFAARLRRDG